MPKLTKGHCSRGIFQNLFKSLSGNLPNITNQFTKFQVSSSNSFFRYLADKVKCPKLQRAITHEILFRIYSKVYQAIYSSLPIYSSSFKAPASVVFEIYFADKGKCPNLQRAITHEIFFRIYSKVKQVIYSSLQINSPSFKSLAPIVRYFADKIKMPKLQRDITHEVFFRIYSKVYQVVYSSLPVYSSSFKVLAPTVFEIFC